MREKTPIFNTPGVVLRATDVGDRDRMLTLLTPEYGKLSVYARGVRKITSGSLPAAQLFAYAKYSLRRGTQNCYLNEAAIEETFLDLASSIEGAALASYLCEAADELSPPDMEAADMVQLVLNTLWTIARGTRPLHIIKGAFELRAAAIAGYMPDLSGCCACGCESCTKNRMMLDIMNGRLLCDTCYEQLYKPQIDAYAGQDPRFVTAPLTDEYGQAVLFRRLDGGALDAMRYVLLTAPKRQFSFTAEGESAVLFSDACETYLLHHIGHGYKTLSFYKSLQKVYQSL